MDIDKDDKSIVEKTDRPLAELIGHPGLAGLGMYGTCRRVYGFSRQDREPAMDIGRRELLAGAASRLPADPKRGALAECRAPKVTREFLRPL
jgi:hypothetical protein